MRLLQILGLDDAASRAMAENAERAVRERGIAGRVQRVTDMDVINEFCVLRTPALVVDGEVRASGRVLSAEEILAFLA